MKLAIAIFVSEDTFETSQGLKRVKRRLATISRLEYDGIEFLVEDPRRVDVEKLKELTKFYDLEVPAIGTGPTYRRYGLSFTDPDERVRRAAVKRMKDYLTLASDLDALVIIGLIRGKIEAEASYKRAWRRIRSCLDVCAVIAEDLGVMLALEPINRYETNFINTIDEALQMISELQSNNVGVMADTFHMNIEETSITESLRKVGKSLIHVHIADSNRWAPGMGHLNFSGVINVLNEIGYSRYLSAEILFKPNFNVAARETMECLEKLL